MKMRKHVIIGSAALALFAACRGGEQLIGQENGHETALTTPGPRVDHAMVYDAAHHQVVLFGGAGGSAAALESTWGWDGASWKLLATQGPGARSDTHLAFDESRGVVVLFGGRRNVQGREEVLNDTWEWNGATWTRRTDAGPGVRVHAAMGYDPASKRVLVYGGAGANDEVLRDTWSWDGTTWKKVSEGGPVDRYVNSMVQRGGELVMSLIHQDTINDGNLANELYRWNGSAWVLTPSAALRFSPLVPVTETATNGSLLYYTGWDAPSGASAHTWLVSATSATPLGAEPGRRKGTAMAFDAQRGRVVLYGGESDTAVLADTWEWTSHWERRP